MIVEDGKSNISLRPHPNMITLQKRIIIKFFTMVIIYLFLLC
uniref:Uncharacterized protein n=1 Tax=Bartonella rochalimae ATCC BAA-1498 TaxID=685782 RepID=E6YNM6_9HYPH|nr:hypothetical protein BARRO_130108 [Bartonella rochalimae ATCC BAA-1498]